jgi:hypothetical protein
MIWNHRVSCVLFVPALALLTLTACSSGTPSKTPEAEKPAPAAAKANGPRIDLNCPIARMQKPPDSFHYSFKREGTPEFVDDEADVTPQTLDGFFKTNMNDVTKPPITSKVHAVSSNQDDWQFATGSLSGMMALAGLGNFIDEGAVREGTDEVNGYDTTKLSVDTTRVDASLTVFMLGTGGFVKGTAWVTSDGCPVKMMLDEEEKGNDGSVTKTHFEENIIKK